METNSNFSIQRIGYLIRKDIWESRKIAGIIGTAVFGLFLMIFMSFSKRATQTPHEVLYPMLLFIGGFIFTSIIFRELYTKARGQFYLTLPASNFEKFSSKWLISAILYPIAITIFYWLFSIIANAIYTYWNGESLVGFMTDWMGALKDLIPIYIVTQAIFFLGAITFTKYNIFKTFFSLFALGMFLMLVFGFLFRFVMWDYFSGMAFNPEFNGLQLETSSSVQVFVQDYVLDAIKYLFWLGFAPFLLLVSYFKLKEREI